MKIANPITRLNIGKLLLNSVKTIKKLKPFYNITNRFTSI